MGIFERLRGRKATQATATTPEVEPAELPGMGLDEQQREPEVGLSAPAPDALHPESIRATRALEVDEEAA